MQFACLLQDTDDYILSSISEKEFEFNSDDLSEYFQMPNIGDALVDIVKVQFPSDMTFESFKVALCHPDRFLGDGCYHAISTNTFMSYIVLSFHLFYSRRDLLMRSRTWSYLRCIIYTLGLPFLSQRLCYILWSIVGRQAVTAYIICIWRLPSRNLVSIYYLVPSLEHLQSALGLGDSYTFLMMLHLHLLQPQPRQMLPPLQLQITLLRSSISGSTLLSLSRDSSIRPIWLALVTLSSATFLRLRS